MKLYRPCQGTAFVNMYRAGRSPWTTERIRVERPFTQEEIDRLERRQAPAEKTPERGWLGLFGWGPVLRVVEMVGKWGRV